MMKKEIPIFFAVDDAYIPFLAVTIKSLSKKVNKTNIYHLRILYTNITMENQKEIMKYQNENIIIEFVNVSESLKKIEGKLLIRDYYSNATYYRILIPNLYPQYEKVLYLDSDIIILDDIAKLYNVNINNYLIGAVSERWFRNYTEFKGYGEKVIGLKSYKKYINAGIMLMNLQKLRNIQFEDKFLHLLETVKYRFAQDQDYFNRICKGNIKYLKEYWNASAYLYKKSNPKIVHYTIFKPWLYKDMPNNQYFWNNAKETVFYDYIASLPNQGGKLKGESSLTEFRRIAKYESDCVGNG